MNDGASIIKRSGICIMFDMGDYRLKVTSG